MSPAVLLLIALGGVALLLLLVLKFKFHPFVALLSVSNCSSTPCRCALPCSSCTPSCPRTPGPVAVAGPFGANIGRILLCGLPVTALVTLVGYFIANRMTKNAYPMSDDVRVEVYGPDVTDEDIREWTVNPESAQTGSPSGHFNPAGATTPDSAPPKRSAPSTF